MTRNHLFGSLKGSLGLLKPLPNAVCCAAFCFTLMALGEQPTPRVFLLDSKFLLQTRQRLQSGDTNLAPAVIQLEDDAHRDLHAGPFSVVYKKTTPPSGDKHDYMSEAPYFWPNPASSNGLPYIRRDGERNPDISHITDHRNLDEVAGTTETLALSYFFKGNEASAEHAAFLLRAFFLDSETRMNPNLEYAQAVLGVNTGRGTGLIESRSLAHIVDTVGLLAGSKAWTDADQRRLQEWFAGFLHWMQESKNGRAEAAAKNNHGTYYDVQVASIALFLDNRQLATDILRAAETKRIAVQIEPDGRQPLELVRTKAWSYSIGNLSGLMMLAALGENVGVDLWRFRTSDGRSIGKALDYLAPYSIAQQKWPHQQIDGLQSRALFPLIRQAAVKIPDPTYREWLKKLPPLSPTDRSNLLRRPASPLPEPNE